MKGTMSSKLTLMGAGAGLVLFAVFGLLPGSFLGGVMGLKLAGSLFGYPVTSNVLPRVVVAVSMLVGVMVSCIIFVMGSGLAGWAIGTLIDAVRAPKAVTEEAREKKA